MTTAKKIKLGILLSFLITLTIIIFQNTAKITTKVLFTSVELPQALLLGIIFLIGAMFGFIMAYIRINKKVAKKISTKEAPKEETPKK